MPEITPPPLEATLEAQLSQPIPKTEIELIVSLRALESLTAGLLRARVLAGSELSNRTLQYLHPKDKDLTDMDRKIMLDAHVREYRANYELLSGYEKLLEQRINIIRELLNVGTRG